MVRWVALGYVGVTVCWWWLCFFFFNLLWLVLEVEGEREEKEEKKRNSKKRNKKEYLNKIGKKERVLGCWVYCKIVWYN